MGSGPDGAGQVESLPARLVWATNGGILLVALGTLQPLKVETFELPNCSSLPTFGFSSELSLKLVKYKEYWKHWENHPFLNKLKNFLDKNLRNFRKKSRLCQLELVIVAEKRPKNLSLLKYLHNWYLRDVFSIFNVNWTSQVELTVCEYFLCSKRSLSVVKSPGPDATLWEHLEEGIPWVPRPLLGPSALGQNWIGGRSNVRSTPRCLPYHRSGHWLNSILLAFQNQGSV